MGVGSASVVESVGVDAPAIIDIDVDIDICICFWEGETGGIWASSGPRQEPNGRIAVALAVSWALSAWTWTNINTRASRVASRELRVASRGRRD